MAGDGTHLPIIAAGTVGEDGGKFADGSGPGVSDALGGVDVSEEHETGRDLGDPLPEGGASDEFHLVVVVVGGVEDSVGRTVGDEDVEPLWDVVPDSIDGAAVLHVGPVAVARREG